MKIPFASVRFAESIENQFLLSIDMYLFFLFFIATGFHVISVKAFMYSDEKHQKCNTLRLYIHRYSFRINHRIYFNTFSRVNNEII